MATETGADEVAIDVPTYFRIFKSGRIERLHLPPILPACLDEDTGVASKDVVLDASTGLFVRVYLPKLQDSSRKLPVLVYFHGGGFVIESAVSATYHNYLNALAAAAGVIVVSVEYRRAPEHQLPAAYEDSWAALQWAASAQGEWIAEHGDVARLFIAGANIVHDMLLRASGNNGPSIEGAILFHPWFAGSEVIDGEQESGLEFSAKLWAYVCPGAVGGSDGPRISRRWRSSGVQGCSCAPRRRTSCWRGAARTTTPWPQARGPGLWTGSSPMGRSMSSSFSGPSARAPSSSWTASWRS